MRFNKTQTRIVIGALLIAVLMGLFPPWNYVAQRINLTISIPLGYSLIFHPPKYGATIDLARLLIQWFLVIFIGAFLLFASRDGGELAKMRDWIKSRLNGQNDNVAINYKTPKPIQTVKIEQVPVEQPQRIKWLVWIMMFFGCLIGGNIGMIREADSPTQALRQMQYSVMFLGYIGALIGYLLNTGINMLTEKESWRLFWGAISILVMLIVLGSTS